MENDPGFIVAMNDFAYELMKWRSKSKRRNPSWSGMATYEGISWTDHGKKPKAPSGGGCPIQSGRSSNGNGNGNRAG